MPHFFQSLFDGDKTGDRQLMTVMTKIADATSVSIGLAGTSNVRTPCGDRHVANIRPGDLVVTRDNGLMPVRLVWSRSVSEAELAADPSLAPICLKPRAVGPMMPQKPLFIAGDHRILIPGYRLVDTPDTSSALIAAREIAGTSDAAFVDRTSSEFKFYNLVFDAQQVFNANGLPVESFLVSQGSLASVTTDVRKTLEESFPDLCSTAEGYSSHKYPTTSREQYLPEFA